MRLFGYDLRVTRATAATVAAPVLARGSGGWIPIIREPSTGAWQRNEELRTENILANPTVFSCTDLISSDIGKCRLRLVQKTLEDVWEETTSTAFSPVLRKPNRYQIVNKFIQQWILSKLVHGNTYVLKQRDNRNVVVAMYVLDPTRVTPLVTPDGGVYYGLGRFDLAQIGPDNPIVPASEIIHDVMVPLFHPLIGVSPIFACALAALQSLKIQDNSTAFFSNGSQPGGVLTAPGVITDATAQRAKTYWETEFSGQNVGRVAVLGDGLKYEPLSVNAVDAQLIEQLKWTTETICGCYHVPAALIDSSHQPPYGKSELMTQQYYSQCLQTLFTCCENSLDEGLELPPPYGTEFDIDDLIWMDTATKTKAAGDSIGAGALSPDEARKKYYGLGSVPGGETPYMQQQYFSLKALAKRDAEDPFSKPAPASAATGPGDEEEGFEEEAETAASKTFVADFRAALTRKAQHEGWHRAA
jgi:HK97 family phage portal protein